jgi:hypothetical protein
MIAALLRGILSSALGRNAVPECTSRTLEGAVLLEELVDAVVFCQSSVDSSDFGTVLTLEPLSP